MELVTCSDCMDWFKTIPASSNNVIITDVDWSLEDFSWVNFLKACKRITRDGCTVIMWGASPKLLRKFMMVADVAQYPIKHMFVWYKPNGANPTGFGISRRWEAVFWLDCRDDRYGELKFLIDVITVPRITRTMRENLDHRWQKPKDLCEVLVRGFSKPGQTVIDPMCGTGVVLKEAKELGRNILGCDIDKKYAEMARNLVFGSSPRAGDLF